MTLREKIEREARITVEAEPEECQIRGNVLASGDDAEDRKAEDAIIERLDNGDVWAWAAVRVCGEWNGLTAEDHLGCCCYEDEEAFRQPGGYFDDMRAVVLESLIEQAEKIVNESRE